MAYTTTARQFFETQIGAALGEGSPLRQVGGVIEFDIEGDNGGTWYVDLDAGSVSTDEQRPSIILHADAIDFMALVEGRMSFSDGLISERLRLSGDAGQLAQLGEAFEAFRAGT